MLLSKDTTDCWKLWPSVSLQISFPSRHPLNSNKTAAPIFTGSTSPLLCPRAQVNSHEVQSFEIEEYEIDSLLF